MRGLRGGRTPDSVLFYHEKFTYFYTKNKELSGDMCENF
jgi:hypothetical protein